MSRNRVTHTAAAAALFAALAGCNSSSGAAASIIKSGSPTSSPSAAPSPTSSAPATPVTPEDQAAALAQQAVRSYYTVTDQLGLTADANLEALRSVTIGSALNDARNQLLSHQKQGWKQIGTTRLLSLNANSVSLVNKPTQQPPLVPTVKVDVCYDVSDLNVVDATGKSVISAQRQDKALAEMGVANYQWPSAQGWRVAYTVITEKPCGVQ